MSTRWRLPLSLLVAVAAVLSACGVPLDSEPNDISAADLPIALRPSGLTADDGSDAGAATTQCEVGQRLDAQPCLYWVGADDRLVARGARSGATATDNDSASGQAQAVLDELLIGPTQAERRNGVGTAIPSRGTGYNSIDVRPDGITLVDLTEESFSRIRGNELKLGVAQVVFSLTSVVGVNQVIFNREGVAISIPDDSGSTEPGQPVNRRNFASIDPDPRVPLFGIDDEFDNTAAPPVTPVGSLPTIATVELSVWMVLDDELVPVIRRIERTPEAILDALLIGPFPAERQRGISSALPPDALVNYAASVELDAEAETVVVDFAEGSLPGLSDRQRLLATAQIVWSLTEIFEIELVQLSVDGVPQSVTTTRGATPVGLPVGRSEFEGLLSGAGGEAGEIVATDPTATGSEDPSGTTAGEDGTAADGTGGDAAAGEDATADNSTADNSTADNSTAGEATAGEGATADNSTADNSTADNSTADNSTADNSTADNSTADNSTADEVTESGDAAADGSDEGG